MAALEISCDSSTGSILDDDATRQPAQLALLRQNDVARGAHRRCDGAIFAARQIVARAEGYIESHYARFSRGQAMPQLHEMTAAPALRNIAECAMRGRGFVDAQIGAGVGFGALPRQRDTIAGIASQSDDYDLFSSCARTPQPEQRP